MATLSRDCGVNSESNHCQMQGNPGISEITRGKFFFLKRAKNRYVRIIPRKTYIDLVFITRTLCIRLCQGRIFCYFWSLAVVSLQNGPQIPLLLCLFRCLKPIRCLKLWIILPSTCLGALKFSQKVYLCMTYAVFKL